MSCNSKRPATAAIASAATATAGIAFAATTAATATPTTAEYIEFDATIPARGVLERTGIALQATEKVVVYASTANCSVNVYGLEQSV